MLASLAYALEEHEELRTCEQMIWIGLAMLTIAKFQSPLIDLPMIVLLVTLRCILLIES